MNLTQNDALIIDVEECEPFGNQLKCRKVEMLNLQSIIKDNNVCKLLRDSVKDKYPPKIFYKLNNPIALRLCNYSRFLKNLNTDDIRYIVQGNCVCTKLPSFVYHPHGHILTGDIELIQDINLKEFFKFGTKFRLPSEKSWKSVMKMIKDSLNLHIDKVSTVCPFFQMFRIPQSFISPSSVFLSK